MSFAFHVLPDDPRLGTETLKTFAIVALALLSCTLVIVTGHIDMGWYGNALLGP